MGPRHKSKMASEYKLKTKIARVRFWVTASRGDWKYNTQLFNLLRHPGTEEA